MDAAQKDRLFASVQWSRRQLEPFRRNRRVMLEQYVGQHYGDSGSRKRVPINLREMAMNIYLGYH